MVYSLTAELALTASSRSDLVATRGLEGTTATTDKAKYDAAVDELRLIHPSRTVPEVEADIVRTQDIKRIAKLKGEKARTERREKLQAIVSSYKPGMAKVADPGSASIQTYLSALGVSVELDILAKWLNLVPVLALELGSALAVVLVNAMPRRETPVTVLEPLPVNHVVHREARASSRWSNAPETRPSRLLADRSQATRDAVSRMIVNHLKDHGGSVAGSERSIAKAVGASKPTLRRAIQALAGTGVVALASSKHGTQLTLLP